MNKKFDKPRLHNKQSLVKRVAWVNIVTQLAFPVAGAFTPVIATAETLSTFQNETWGLPTEPYVLKSGENVKIVAKRYGLTVSDLKKINQLRTFDKPFITLGVGSEIDVPKPRNNKFLPFNYSSSEISLSKQPLLKQSSLEQPSLDKVPLKEDKSSIDENSSNLAEISSRIGQLLASDDIKNNAASQLNSLAMGEANQKIQNWLGRYGTARVQLNIDSHGHLNDSQFDMLLPLYDTYHQMIFTQFGLRHIDKRNTANIGFGQRHFFDDWMLGYNAFFDHDITGDNSRLGLGAEYARNYLKLAANGYIRLSNWKESRLLTDYDERPANGFDLKVQGYLPSLPQFGGKLVYEQYFGNEVGLMSKDHRQKNPSAFTFGVDYTPIPLLTFGIDRKQAMSGGGETLFNIELSYEIGTPWAKQIDPDAVAFKRSLQGSRYDLVDRNNQIVLEYRKREVISLAIDNLIIGHARDTKPLHVSVNSKYGFKDIEWDAADFFANGGNIQHQGSTHYLLTLPKYQSQGNNTYTVGAIAYDEHGNTSKRAEVKVQVLPAVVNANKSTFSAKDKELLADGHVTTLLTLTLKDKDDKPIRGAASDIKLVSSGLSGNGSDPKIDKMKEVQPGIYESKLTAGEKSGVLKITPEVEGIIIKPVEIMFVHPEAPIVKNLAIAGKLEMGQKLSATYTFNPNHGDPTDKSIYVWGNKGNIDITKGHTITESGKIPDYTLTLSDAGRVKEIAVQAKNAMDRIGNTQSVDTSMSADQGNHTHDGGKGGTVRGLADDMTITVSADKVKNHEPIILKIKTLNHEQPAQNVAVRVNAIKSLNRQNVTEKITALLRGKSGTYQGFTDDQGVLSIAVTDPNGLGVKTTLSISVDGIAASQTKDVIFTVATSPDVPVANFWGHMPDTVVAENGVIFKRPRLQAELMANHLFGQDTYTEDGEIWPRRHATGAAWYCKKIHSKLPTKEDLMALYRVHPNNAMHDQLGWPERRSYRSATIGKDEKGKDEHYVVNINEGFEHVVSDKVYDYVICKE
ncbi:MULTISPECIES: inverse autotransporter beta domain-containing protein [Xenorhabdus]|uniref:Adhesin/invasin n=1 Tax=Xenorhabdus ehlersii TaxID=290111 RepID=A0A2D0IPN8_9GAMM|nr:MULTISPECIES: inverse autotransporter beta domain-containing protein [Xenorhabdus]MBC8948972.1 putative invasin [Xenorhabdus sp. TS4]PHM23831.1 putative invasin [Xenorhabdus ehlersii]RKE89205.1 adhesin/invasin [Xenorhabdus ehlersii]